MGIFKTAREIKKYDAEAEKITGYKLNPIAPPPDPVWKWFDEYVDARRHGQSKEKSIRIASKNTGLKLKKAS